MALPIRENLIDLCHFQNSKIDAEPLWEKNIICALPIKFFLGTKPTSGVLLSLLLSLLSPIKKKWPLGTLNSIVSELVPKDPDFADGKVLEQTIKTRVRRKLENALSGKEETKDGYQSHGIAWEDGYNYWISRDHTSEGAAKVFIQRGKDFKRNKWVS